MFLLGARTYMTYSKKWTLENIKKGFELFICENNRQPTPSEINAADYLPSCRQIQRIFGGLPQLRELLGYEDIYLSKGKHRSRIAQESNKKSRESETRLRDIILCERFHKPFVHIERPIDEARKTRVDFYVFNPVENFAVDIFTTETYHDLESNVYIKLREYFHLKEKIYFVVSSEKLTEGDVSLFVSRKAEKFPSNIKLISLNCFLERISSISAYQNPLPAKRA